MDLTRFHVDKRKCIGCGRYVRVCSGGVLSLDEHYKAQIKPNVEFGWEGCWQCQHCLAICPQGAISIFDRHPEDSLPTPDSAQAAPLLDALMTSRRSCRRYLDRDVPMQVIEEMLNVLQNIPTGSNKRLVEYTLLDREQTWRFHKLVYTEMERQASEGIYPRTFDAHYYGIMKDMENIVRPDMLMCSAPYLLIPHAPTGVSCAVQDVNIACAWFELLCASRGLGCAMMTFPLVTLEKMPDLYRLLEIPDNHYASMMVGFGYPELPYPRGVQRQGCAKIHWPKIPK